MNVCLRRGEEIKKKNNAGLNVLLESFCMCVWMNTHRSTHTLSGWIFRLGVASDKSKPEDHCGGERDTKPLEKMCATALSSLNTQNSRQTKNNDNI